MRVKAMAAMRVTTPSTAWRRKRLRSIDQVMGLGGGCEPDFWASMAGVFYYRPKSTGVCWLAQGWESPMKGGRGRA
jgi:hypothetical protein